MLQSFIFNHLCTCKEKAGFLLFAERTEKVPMGSIKNVISEPIEGHEEYHMLVSSRNVLSSAKAKLKTLCADQFESSTSPPWANPWVFELLKIGLFKFPPLGAI